MASLTVGNVTLGFLSVRTEGLSFRTVMDPSGRHYECHEVTLDLAAVVNEVAVTTGRGVQKAMGADAPGDTLPFALNRLGKFLLQPRRPVTYEVAGTAVVDSPAFTQDGTRLSCDVKGGPYPQMARFIQVTGDQTAILLYRVTTYVSDSDNFIANHAWDARCSVDNRGYTTRTISGRMAFNIDLLQDRLVKEVNVQPDFFRKIAFPPVAAGMRRVHVDVTQPRVMDELTYSVTDREITTGLGTDSEATEMTGTVNSSVENTIKSPKDLIGKAVAIAKKAAQKDLVGVFAIVFDSTVPMNRNVGTVRVYGRKGCDRNNLAKIAKNVILDRFRPLDVFGKAFVPAMSVSHNVDSDYAPYAECRIDVFGANPFKMSALTVDGDVFNLSANYSANDGVFAGPGRGGPALPGGGGSRGTWLGRLVSQALVGADDQLDLPADPPDDNVATDLIKE